MATVSEVPKATTDLSCVGSIHLKRRKFSIDSIFPPLPSVVLQVNIQFEIPPNLLINAKQALTVEWQVILKYEVFFIAEDSVNLVNENMRE